MDRQKVLVLTTCAYEKAARGWGSWDRIEEEMRRRYGFPRVLGRDAYQHVPERVDRPFALPARLMYQGHRSTYKRADPFIREIERKHDVDIFFISGGYRIVGGRELIYYYECELGDTGSYRMVRPESVAPFVLNRLERETQRLDFNSVVVSLSADYFRTIYDGERALWRILSDNLTKPHVFVIGPRDERRRAVEYCMNLGLKVKGLQKDRNFFNYESKATIRKHLNP